MKRLFFDIETSFNIGLFWKAGWKQNISPDQIIKERAIICISWKWEGEDKVYNLTWDKNQSDKKMIKQFIKIMNSADEVIAHNGDKFDIKWLRTRCLFHNIPMMPEYQSLDTLKIIRSQFYLNSNKLDYIASYLGLGHKMETGGLDLWKKIILNDDKQALQKMVSYCDKDVILLEKVFNKIKNYSKHKLNYASLNGGNSFDCPECCSNKVSLSKTSTTAAGTKRRHLKCKKCKKNYTISDSNYTKLLEHKLKAKLV